MFGRQTNFLFDHLPKTGGTAFRKVLEELFGRENVSPTLEGRSELWAVQRYPQLRVISGHFLSLVRGDMRSGGRARITILRHPIDRAISEYFYWRHHAFEGVDDKLARWAQEYDICSYFRMREESNESSATNFYTRHFASRLSREIKDQDALRSLARRSLAMYSFVGISEQMDDSVDVFCRQFKLPPVNAVPRENVTSFRIGMDRLDAESYDRLRTMNELDFELYENARADFDARKRRLFRELLLKNDIRRRQRLLGGSPGRSQQRGLRLALNGLSRVASGILRAEPASVSHERKSREEQCAPVLPPNLDSGAECAHERTVEERRESFGDGAIAITSAIIRGSQSGTNTAAPGEMVFLTIRILARTDEQNLTVGFDVRDGFGETVFGTNTYQRRQVIPVSAGHEYEIRFAFRANLNRGRYIIGAALHTGADHSERCYEWRSDSAQLDVVQLGEPDFIGYCRLDPAIEWREVKEKNVGSDAGTRASTCGSVGNKC